jgi:hypothetical protein
LKFLKFRASGAEVIVAEEAGAAVVAAEVIQAEEVVVVVEVANKTTQILKRPLE